MLVVSPSLKKRLATQRLFGSFAFYKHQRLAIAVVDTDVGPLLALSALHQAFHLHERERVTEILMQIGHQMLPNPFFGRKHHQFFAHLTEYHRFAFQRFYPQWVLGQIEWRERIGWHDGSEYRAANVVHHSRLS